MRDITDLNERDLEGVFNEIFRPMAFSKQGDMKTDIKENDKQYELDIDIPGFNKDEINITLNNGTLNVSAKKEQKKESGNEEKGNYVRRERSYISNRSYYVGNKISENEIKAKYENGVLNLIVPKEQPKEIPTHKIQID